MHPERRVGATAKATRDQRLLFTSGPKKFPIKTGYALPKDGFFPIMTIKDWSLPLWRKKILILSAIKIEAKAGSGILFHSERMNDEL
jgi:hypothetical protein